MLSQFHWNCWRRSCRFAKNYGYLRKFVFQIQSGKETTIVWNQLSPAEDGQIAKNRASIQCWSLFRCCRYYPSRFCSCRLHCEESSLFCSVETSVREHIPCQKRAVPEKKLAALAWWCPVGRWMWIHFLLPNRFLWSSIPPTCHICHRQIFLLPEGERVLKERRFSYVSYIQLDVTELLKGIELQDFQRTFEDLCKRS